MRQLIADARREGVELRFDAEEAAKHEVTAEDGVVVTDASVLPDVDLCIALGGDGTILRALRRYARTSVPVFAVNFGEVGFLATVEPDEMTEGFDARVPRGSSSGSTSRRSTCGIGASARTSRSTTSRCTGAWATASRSCRTSSTARRSARCAATGSWSARPPARRATTSPTAGRSWPGAWRASGSRSSRRTRSRPASLVVAPDDGLRILSRSRARRGPLGRRPPGGRARARGASCRRGSCPTRRCSRSSPGRPSTAGCGRSSGASRG